MTDRELDAKVAEGLGFNIAATAGMDWICVFQPNPEEDWAPVPFYSTDIAAAFEGPLEAILADGWEIEINCFIKDGQRMCNVALYHEDKKAVLHNEWQPSMAKALCLAFLKARLPQAK